MKTRIVYTKLWQDTWFKNLEPREKYLWLYYISNEDINIIHLFELPNEKAEYHTGIKQNDIQKIKEKFEQEGKIKSYKDYIFLSNAHKFETYSGSRNALQKLRILRLLSDDALQFFNCEIELIFDEIVDEIAEKDKSLFDRLFKRFSLLKNRGIDRGINTPIHRRQKTEIRNKKTEIRKQKGKIKKEKELFEKPEYLENIPEEDIEVFIDAFEVSKGQVIKKAKEMRDWLESKGLEGKYKNFKALLRNAIRKDFGEKDEVKRKHDRETREAVERMKARDQQGKKPMVEIDPKKAEENKKRLDELRAKMKNKFAMNK